MSNFLNNLLSSLKNNFNKYRNQYGIVIAILIIFILCSLEGCTISVVTPTVPTFPPTKTTQTFTPTDIHLEFPPTKTQSYSNLYGIIVDCNYLNIRIEPNDSSQIISSVPVNSNVKIIQESYSVQNGNWYEIEYNGYSGWVYGKYVKFSNP